jgi:glycosyltransferase involved in cell wall biosynthesis
VVSAARYRAVTNISTPVRLVGGSAQAIRDTYRVCRRLRADKPSLLHLCTSGGLATAKDIAMLRLARAFGVPSVIHYRMGRLPSIAARRSTEWKLTRRAMALASVVVTLDGRSEDLVKQDLPGSLVVTLPNMVEMDAIDDIRRSEACRPPVPGGPMRVVYVGQLLRAKGIRELVEACVQLPRDDVVLDLVGPVSRGFRALLEGIAAGKASGRWLEFHGSVNHDQALRHILSADVFVLPSYTEGAPNVIMEAMACEKAILATPVGAVPEMLDIGAPQPCGVCVEPRNTDALLEALRQLLDDGDRRRQLGRRARDRAERLYAVPVACDRLLGLWRSVAK